MLSIYIFVMHHISISVRALTLKQNLSALSALIIRLERSCISQHSQLANTGSEQKQPSLPKMNLLHNSA